MIVYQVYLYMGVSKNIGTQNGWWKSWKTLLTKWDDLGWKPTIFGNIHMYKSATWFASLKPLLGKFRRSFFRPHRFPTSGGKLFLQRSKECFWIRWCWGDLGGWCEKQEQLMSSDESYCKGCISIVSQFHMCRIWCSFLTLGDDQTFARWWALTTRSCFFLCVFGLTIFVRVFLQSLLPTKLTWNLETDPVEKEIPFEHHQFLVLRGGFVCWFAAYILTLPKMSHDGSNGPANTYLHSDDFYDRFDLR